MNLSDIIYWIGAFGVGVIIGLIIELCIDTKERSRLIAENDTLRDQLEVYRANDNVEIINIPKADKTYFKPF